MTWSQSWVLTLCTPAPSQGLVEKMTTKTIALTLSLLMLMPLQEHFRISQIVRSQMKCPTQQPALRKAEGANRKPQVP